MSVEEILEERGKTYGNYLEQATIAKQIRFAIFHSLRLRRVEMGPDQHDAIHMIAVKLSRIANGDPNYADNWRDIAGYATLVADRLEGKSR
jgi:hypothetical protein